MWVSLPKYCIPLIAGCIVPSCFACLWAKLVRINQPHCSQVGIVGQLKAGIPLVSAGSKLVMVGIPPYSSSPQPGASTALSSLARLLPWDTCWHHGLVIFAWIGVHCSQPWPPLQQERKCGGAQRTNTLGEAQRYHNLFALIILVICTSQGYKAASILRM